MIEYTSKRIVCPHCGHHTRVELDASQGDQEFYEDCRLAATPSTCVCTGMKPVTACNSSWMPTTSSCSESPCPDTDKNKRDPVGPVCSGAIVRLGHASLKHAAFADVMVGTNSTT